MSKIYKATIYISDINGICEDIEDIKQQLKNSLEDLSFTFEKVQEKDVTNYIDTVGDDYSWNTTDEYKRTIVLHNVFAGDEV